MAFISQLPGALGVFLLLQCCFSTALAQNKTENLPTFGDTVQVLGAMERTDQDFKDGLVLDLFSPKNRTLVVKQNTSPLGAQFITGTTGAPFVALSNYSYIIQMNETANDLIAKIEIPYEPVMLSAVGIQESNTYVGTLAPDKKSWIIDDSTRNVHRSENNTRIIKMTSLDGEYLLVGRQTADTSNIFVQYGQGATRTVNITGGPGIQENEFVDGLRFSVQADKAMMFNVDLKEGVNPRTLPPGTMNLNSYAWIVNSSDPSMKISATMLVPFNRAMLMALQPAGSTTLPMLSVGKRALNATSGQFLPMNANAQVDSELNQDRIEVPNVTQLNGQYLLLVTKPAGATGAAPSMMKRAGEMGKRSLRTSPGVRRRSLMSKGRN